MGRLVSTRLVVACTILVAVLLFGCEPSAKAADAQVSWINGQVLTQQLSDYQENSDVQIGNTPCVYVQGYYYGTTSSVWYGSSKGTSRQCAAPGQTGYYNGSYFLPHGGDTWQIVDLDYYPAPVVQPNPNTDGVVLVTNAGYQYGQRQPSYMYYASDWRTVFGRVYVDGLGNVHHDKSGEFVNQLKYSDGTPVDVRGSGAGAYSANGEWLYMNLSTAGQLRVHLPDLTAFSFAPPFSSGNARYMSVSNSGLYVVTGSYDTGIIVYDLNACGSEQPRLASRGCAKRDITDSVRGAVKSSLPDPSLFRAFAPLDIKFKGDSTIDLVLNVYAGDVWIKKSLSLKLNTGAQPSRYLALGDSFSSGEGALSYRSGTDFYVSDNNYNLCHQSTISYPYLLKASISPDWFGAVTCSGSEMRDIVYSDVNNYWTEQPQAKGIIYPEHDYRINSSLLPGYIDQNKFVNVHSPTLATITIGGNDVGFGSIVAECVVNKYIMKQSCYSDRESRERLADFIEQQIPALTSTFKTLKEGLSGDQKLYVIGYPQVVNPAGGYTVCGLNVNMRYEERVFASNLVDFLNQAIRIAATNAGARFVDVSMAFYDADRDYRLCGNQTVAAVNGLMTTNPGSNKKPIDVAYHESYHPNALGHSLLAKKIRDMTNDFNLGMPTPPARQITVVGGNFRNVLVGDELGFYSDRSYLRKDMFVEYGPKNEQLNLKFQTNATSLPARANSNAVVELHSTPVVLATVPIGPTGTTTLKVTIPDSVPIGYHQLHVYYTDITGQKVDLFQYVYVVHSLVDYDGNGIPNNQEKCLLVPASGVDDDADGIDDACDGEYVAADRGAKIEQELPRIDIATDAINIGESKRETDDTESRVAVNDMDPHDSRDILSSSDSLPRDNLQKERLPAQLYPISQHLEWDILITCGIALTTTVGGYIVINRKRKPDYGQKK